VARNAGAVVGVAVGVAAGVGTSGVEAAGALVDGRPVDGAARGALGPHAARPIVTAANPASRRVALRATMSIFTASDPRRARIIAELRAAGCVFAEDEADLLITAALRPDELTAMVARRVGGEPIEHILGWVEFAGVRVSVGPGVFVPRRRTEYLVAEAVSRLPTGPAIAVDLCCGSGAIGLALASVSPGRLELHASDVDPVAVACARRNLAGVGGQVHEGDLYSALPARLRGRVTVLVANVPYVPTDAMALLPSEARLHEPRAALDGGRDGLDVFRRVATGAADWLTPGGHLLVEVGEEQASSAVAALATAGLAARVARSDEYAATVVIGTRLTR